MRDLIITPFGDDRLVLFPGRPGAVRLPPGHYAQLAQSAGTSLCPDWLADVILAQRIPLHARPHPWQGPPPP